MKGFEAGEVRMELEERVTSDSGDSGFYSMTESQAMGKKTAVLSCG
jgi:hypothetical protein